MQEVVLEQVGEQLIVDRVATFAIGSDKGLEDQGMKEESDRAVGWTHGQCAGKKATQV